MDKPPPLPKNGFVPPVLSYATPMGYQNQAVWRKGNILVMRKNSNLPFSCVKCNDPTGGRPVFKKLYWHSPVLYLLIPVGLLIYAIVAMAVRDSITVNACLCPKHYAARTRNLLIGWLLVVVGLVSAVFGFAQLVTARNGNIDLITALSLWGGIGVLIVGAVWALIGGRVLWPKKIDNNFAWLAGGRPGISRTILRR